MDSTPLEIAKYFDDYLVFCIEQEFNISAKSMKIFIELRKVFLRIYALDNDTSLSDYLNE